VNDSGKRSRFYRLVASVLSDIDDSPWLSLPDVGAPLSSFEPIPIFDVDDAQAAANAVYGYSLLCLPTLEDMDRHPHLYPAETGHVPAMPLLGDDAAIGPCWRSSPEY
jgi:hypothetical protein